MSKEVIQVTRSSMPSLDEFIEEVAPLWESHWLTNMGEKHQQLESALKCYLNTPNVALFTNGHTALEAIFEALELGNDDRKKVITTPFTFASTTHAIVRKGLDPVFADIKHDDYTIDPESVASLMDDDVCAIVPVHVYGNLCDVEAIQEIADSRGVKVIYDAAHAFGVEKAGVSAAAFGDVSMFSFHATKVFNTIEGGAATFADDKLYETLNHWKNFGITGPENVVFVGGNGKMNEFCAAMGLCNLRHVDDEIAKRKVVAETYWSRLESLEGVRCVKPAGNVRHNYAYMPVMFEDSFGASRDEVYEALLEHGIVSRKYFFPLTNDFECYSGRFDSRLTPVARHVSARILTLPLYADLSVEDANRICDVVVSLKN